MGEHLAVLDAPGIKDYVFGTDRLVEIRGASALLDDLNRNRTAPFLRERLGGASVDCVFSNGGSGQFLLKGAREEVEGALEALRGLYRRESRGGVRLVYGLADLSSGDYPGALKTAHLSLKRAKEEGGFEDCGPLHAGYLRECDSCSGCAARITRYGSGEGPKLLCEVCARKEDAGRERGLWKGLVDLWAERGESADEAWKARPGDFQVVGEACRARRGYAALVYADGNAMGRLVKSIRTAEDYRFFSTAVDDSIREACYEALYENHAVYDAFKSGGTVPADVLLLGGDDLLVVLSADAAPRFALDAARKFEEKTRERFASSPFFSRKLQGNGLTISLGIAFGRSHTPFSILLGQAEELLKSAKAAGSLRAADSVEKNDSSVSTYIDYHLASRFNQVEVGRCRRTHLEIREGSAPLFLYRKPYSLEDWEILLHCGRELARVKMARSRLKRLGQAPSLGKANGSLECLMASMNATKEQRRVLWEALNRFECGGGELPWREEEAEDGSRRFSTMLVDLVELLEMAI